MSFRIHPRHGSIGIVTSSLQSESLQGDIPGGKEPIPEDGLRRPWCPGAAARNVAVEEQGVCAVHHDVPVQGLHFGRDILKPTRRSRIWAYRPQA